MAGAVKKNKPEQWFLQTPDGSQYGPVVRDELDQWFTEGRVSVECQLLKEGSTQWQWAADLYPELAKLPGSFSNSSAAPLTSSPLSNAAVSTSPLTPLSSAGPFSDPLGSMPLGTPALSPLGSAPSSTATLPSYTSNQSLGAYAPSSSSSPNPYSAPTLGGSYGAYPQRTGPHPMVIVAGIFHILMGASNVVLFLATLFVALMLILAGGTAAAIGTNLDEANAQGMAGGLAAFGIIGSIIAFLVAIGFLVYGIAQIWASIGLFRRQRSAKVATFVFAGLGSVFVMACFGMLARVGGIFWAVALVAELPYVIILFVAMCLPDATRDFR
ncbi:MAG TPA: hypothetical protein VMP01_09990 [Pirellulaceae bacterium]|nr:hypothetical protein [Pirellulaceae bacterium]